MAQIAGQYDQSAEASSDFDPIPAGDYRAKLISGDIEDISKNSNKGRCLKFTWQIETGPCDVRLVWQRLNLWAENMNNCEKVIQIANSQFATIREATGILTPNDTDDLLHIPCTIRVGVKLDPNGVYSPQNVIKNVKPVGDKAASNNAPQAAQVSQAASTQQQATQKTVPWNK